MEYTVFDIAKWFLDAEPNMSHKKLQKLCWYAYSWYIAINYDPEMSGEITNRLFDTRAEAWVHGPVFVNLYQDFQHNEKSKILKSSNITNEEITSFLNNVLEIYGKISGDGLESMTHQELPWKRARKDLLPYASCSNNISDIDILDEYLPRLQGN